MNREWNDNQPIYRQLRDRVVHMILDGLLKEGDPLPSVRNWPRVHATIQRLGLDPKELLDAATRNSKRKDGR